MTGRHFVVATAGHVDHGKSALVKALTGTDPDRLPEEKAREITIDLGFAHLDLKPDGNEPVSVSIIDVPGHEDFVRNMIAGLGSVDLALLVVAADDGWMPQTEEHLQILTYLGLSRLVVALNKIDMAPPERAMRQIRQKLEGTAFAAAPIIPISTRSGTGIEPLKEVLGHVLVGAAPQRDVGKTRLFIDRAFNLPGIGAVVTGTLSGGTISVGQPAFLQPENFKTRVRSIQSHREAIPTAQPGMRVGINLAELPKNSPPGSLRRGYLLTTEPFEPSSTIDVIVEKSGRVPVAGPATRPLPSGTHVFFHHGTARVPALLVLARDDTLGTGQSAIAKLRLETPVLAFLGDRFVIRDRSEQHTVAGGVILDPNGAAKSFRNPDQQELLQVRQHDVGNVAVCVESEIRRRGVTPVGTLLMNSNFSRQEIRVALEDSRSRNRVVLRGEIAAPAPLWQGLRQHVIDLIDVAHKANSEQRGLDLTELRTAMPQLSPQATDALIDDLCTNGFVRRGSAISRASHRPTLPAQLESEAKQILSKLSQKLFDPPSRGQIAVDPNQRQALRYLIEEGLVVDLGPDLVLSGEAFIRAREIVVQSIKQAGPATVSELREQLKTSRRVAVPLLERLDRDRVTRRLGDRRVLADTKAVQTPTGTGQTVSG